jgi:hypothetical protein
MSELLGHGLAVLGPFADLEGGPVGGGARVFAVGWAEVKDDGEAAFGLRRRWDAL